MSIQPNVTLRCGDSWVFYGQCINPDGTVVNLTGCNALFKLNHITLDENIFTGVVGMGVFFIDAANGYLQYGLNKLQTAALPSGNYYYTLQIEYPDGITAYTYFEGMIIATPNLA